MSNRAVQRRESLMKAKGQQIPGTRPASSSMPSYPQQHPSAMYPVPQQPRPSLNNFQIQQMQQQQMQQQQMQQQQMQQQQMMQQQQQQRQQQQPQQQQPYVSETPSPTTNSFMTYETFLELYKKQTDEHAKQTQDLISCINELKNGIVNVIQSSHQITTDRFQQEKEKNDKMFGLFGPAVFPPFQKINVQSTDKNVLKTKTILPFAEDSLPGAAPFIPSDRPVQPYGNSHVYVPLTPSFGQTKIEQSYSFSAIDHAKGNSPSSEQTSIEQSSEIPEQPQAQIPQVFKPDVMPDSPLKESVSVSPIFEVTPIAVVSPMV